MPQQHTFLATLGLAPAPHPRHPPQPAAPLQLLSYATYVVMFSGGKDSIASYLALREAGVPNARIELWHHAIDGREGSALMDWPCTPAYCARFAAAFGVPLYTSWRVGGFERELLRDHAATAPVRFETPDGTVGQAGGVSGTHGTRRRFPQQSANLRVRWCSAALKVDVAAAALRNQPRFAGARTLVITGERAEESAARAGYARCEPHRADRRASPQLARHIDHHRPIHGWSAAQVWAILARWRINPHPAYRLGWGRVSCAGCVFASANQWASLRAVNPAQVAQIADYEACFGHTIRRDRRTVRAAADQGRPYPAITPARIAEATNPAWDGPIILPPDQPWELPAGAFGDSAGPT